MAALGLGAAQGAFEMSLRYANEREQFGRPIGTFQAVAFKLADMATEIEAGRQLVYQAAWLKDRAATSPDRSDGQALHRRAVAAGVQRGGADPRRLRVHGRVPGEPLLRDQKVLEIGEGTNEVQRMVIARGLGL